MIRLIKFFILKVKLRKLYKELPVEVRYCIWRELNEIDSHSFDFLSEIIKEFK